MPLPKKCDVVGVSLTHTRENLQSLIQSLQSGLVACCEFRLDADGKPVALRCRNAKDEVIQSDAPVLATVEAVLAEQPAALSPLPVAPSPLSEPTTWPARLPPMIVPPSERDEIKQRLANFKAHQLKMQTEREDYYLQTMTRTRALAARLHPTKDQ